MPLSPPVQADVKATDQTIWAKASVSMARYTPDKRMQNQPNRTATAAAASGAAARLTGIGEAACFTSSAQA